MTCKTTHPHFYKKPVQLEDENCDDFLGFNINANNRQVTYNLRPEAWRYSSRPVLCDFDSVGITAENTLLGP